MSTQHPQSYHARRGSSEGFDAEASSDKLYVTTTPIREHTAGRRPSAHLVTDRDGIDKESPCKSLDVSAK